MSTISRRAVILLLSGLACGFVQSWPQAAGKGKVTVLEVRNPLDIPHSESVLELPLNEVLKHTGIGDGATILVENALTHQDLPTQLYSSSAKVKPDLLLVLVSLGSHETIRLSFHESKTTAAWKPLVFGRPIPERMDDFAWENDRVAFRVYGPALQATGEISSGIDVWSKRVHDLVINDWYARDAEGIRTKNPALSYHRDNGQGMDGYKVGPSRGCGGTGVFSDGKVSASQNYTSVRILASGPIRFSFELKYAPWNVGAETVVESKRITLDAGSHLNRIESTMSWSGSETMKFATGLALHRGSLVSAMAGDRILSVWEPTSEAVAGMDATGIVWTNGRSTTKAEANGNTLLMTPIHSGEAVSYYAGQGWSEGDMPSRDEWNRYLQSFLLQQQRPLELHWY